MSEYKKYDSNDEFRISGVRIAKEPRVFEGEHGKLVALTFAVTSRKDKHKDIWMTANVNDFQADIASYLDKGDILHEIRGKLVNRPWDSDDGQRDSLELERAQLVIPADLFATLRERGWEPSAAAPNKKGAKGKPAKGAQGKGKPPAKGPAKRRPVDIDADDDEYSDDEE